MHIVFEGWGCLVDTTVTESALQEPSVIMSKKHCVPVFGHYLVMVYVRNYNTIYSSFIKIIPIMELANDIITVLTECVWGGHL